jgi:CBS domain-containing protein
LILVKAASVRSCAYAGIDVLEEKPMDAAEIMTRFVISVAPSTTMTEIAKCLAEHAISGVPVCEADGKLVGIVTEGDLVRPLMRSRERRRDWWLRHLAEGTELAPEFLSYVTGAKSSARELMRANVVTATETTHVGDIAELMITHDIKRVPIVRGDKLVGIVTRADLVKTMARNPEALLSPST